MTATEELRALLDERGVEYTIDHGYREFFWDFGESGRARARAIGTSGRVQMIVTGITPEQAVAATLGRGTCRDSNKRFDAWLCSECGATLLLMFDDCGEPTYSVDGVADVPHYCPNCGRKVME